VVDSCGSATVRERSVRMITGKRPGYGRSTRLPGRGFAEHADDMARVLDHLDLDRVFVCGQSGGAPHALAFAARHPGRLRAASIRSGMAPLTDEDATQVIPINQQARRLVAAHDVDGLRTLLTPIAAEMLADSLAGYAAQMATAPPEDHTVMTDPLWQQGYIRATREALGAGFDGWVDETLAILGDWPDVPLPAVTTSLVWSHARRGCCVL
jgi:pimeloyl-ACP methyl ester carboxylesterase